MQETVLVTRATVVGFARIPCKVSKDRIAAGIWKPVVIGAVEKP